jgi:hypothetical protein
METLVAISEVAPGMARKFPQFMKFAINSCFALMMSVDDESDWCATH